MSAPDLGSIQAALAGYISEEILLCRDPLELDADLFDAGFDSMSLTRLRVFVEQRFGLTIPDQDIDLDKLSTIGNWALFVHARLARSAT